MSESMNEESAEELARKAWFETVWFDSELDELDDSDYWQRGFVAGIESTKARVKELEALVAELEREIHDRDHCEG